METAEHILSDVTKSASISSAPADSMTQTALLLQKMTHRVSLINTNQLMLFKEIIAALCEKF
jgi:hypothetical protein